MLKDLSNYPINELAPTQFVYREVYQTAFDYIKTYLAESGKDYLSFDDIEVISNYFYQDQKNNRLTRELIFTKGKRGIDGLVTEIAGAVNAKTIFVSQPSYLLNLYSQSHTDDSFDPIFYFKDKRKEVAAPINTDYVASLLYNNHIIGTAQPTTRTKRGSFLIFDSRTFNAEQKAGNNVHAIINEYDEISELLTNIITDDHLNQVLKISTPEQTTECFKQIPEIQPYLDAPAGVWEGFTVSEHSESVERVFNDTFDVHIPTNLLPFFKLLFISHDLGKGVAKLKGKNIKVCTAQAIDDLSKAIELKPEIQELLKFIINDSQTYTTAYFVNHKFDALEQLRNTCRFKLAEIFGIEPSEKLINEMVSVCAILQNCDSASYTLYGITRNQRTGVWHRNANENFTKNFHVPPDARKRKLLIIDPREKHYEHH